MNELIGQILIIFGLAFDLFGCIGLIRLPDVYNRLQAAAKCVTLGTGGILFGIFVINGFTSLGIKALLAMVFVFLTSPTAAQALSRAAYVAGIKPWEKSVETGLEEELKQDEVA